MPKKPVWPRGAFVFPQRGSPWTFEHILPTNKKEHELRAFRDCLQSIENLSPRSFLGVQQLEENHPADFSCMVADVKTWVQLAELVQRSWIDSEPVADQETRYLNPDGSPLYLNERKRDEALASTIKNKIEKSYQKPDDGPFWLVIFTTAHYPLELVEAGVLHVTAPLLRAREYLRSLEMLVFDEIWFSMNPAIAAVRVWPDDGQQYPVAEL